VLRVALKGAVGHKGRLFLMAMAIVLGVAFIAGSYVFTDTMKDSFDVLFEQETSVDLGVRAEADLTEVVLREGRIPQELGEVAIDAYTASEYGFALGDPIDLLLPSGVRTFFVVGTAGYGDADNLLGATVVLFDVDTAQLVLGFWDEYSQIAIVADEGGDPEPGPPAAQ